MKVLIVDDEPIVRRALRRALEQRGHAVVEAASGLEGLSQWRAHDPDLVFLDVLMPGLSGPELLAELGRPRRARVVMMSAYAGEHDSAQLSALGVDQFHSKPFSDIFQVVHAAEKLVDERGSQSPNQES